MAWLAFQFPMAAVCRQKYLLILNMFCVGGCGAGQGWNVKKLIWNVLDFFHIVGSSPYCRWWFYKTVVFHKSFSLIVNLMNQRDISLQSFLRKGLSRPTCLLSTICKELLLPCQFICEDENSLGIMEEQLKRETRSVRSIKSQSHFSCES